MVFSDGSLSVPIQKNKLQKVAISIGKTEKSIIVDGVVGVSIKNGDLVAQSSGQMTIGCYNSHSCFFDGSISNVMIYKGELPLKEIQRIQAGKEIPQEKADEDVLSKVIQQQEANALKLEKMGQQMQDLEQENKKLKKIKSLLL